MLPKCPKTILKNLYHKKQTVMKQSSSRELRGHTTIISGTSKIMHLIIQVWNKSDTVNRKTKILTNPHSCWETPYFPVTEFKEKWAKALNKVDLQKWPEPFQKMECFLSSTLDSSENDHIFNHQTHSNIYSKIYVLPCRKARPPPTHQPTSTTATTHDRSTPTPPDAGSKPA
jgi:hypothetical protein